MKRFIRSSSTILGMAHSRKQIKSNAEFYQDDIACHVMKCLVYSRNHRDYNHWINDELAAWIADINSMAPKKGFKIKPHDYSEWLLGGFGDELSDMKLDLKFFRNRFVVKHDPPYPDFNITPDMCDKLYLILQKLSKDVMSKIGTYDSINSIRTELHKVLDPICNSAPWLK